MKMIFVMRQDRSDKPPMHKATNRECRGRRRSCFSAIAVTLAGLVTFMGVLGCGDGGTGAVPADSANAAARDGKRWFSQTCVSCHGPNGQGVPRMGPSLHQNQFVAASTDEQLVAFLREGRSPTDPKSVTKLPMPPRGGNANLTDDNLKQVVAFLRDLQKS